MLQRTKSRDNAGLSIVPSGDQTPEQRALSPNPTTLPDVSSKRSPGGALKARRTLLLGAVAAAALAGAAWFGFDYATVGRFMISTDDAYVRAHTTTLGTKVPGYVEALLVDDNARVRAGDVIARIDDGDYRLAVNSAREKAATQQATIQRFDRQIVAQRAMVDQAKAQVVSAQAAQRRAQSEYDRQQALAGKEFASKQALERALADRDQTVAALRSAEAAVDGATANVGVLQAQRQEAVGTLAELKTALAKVERDLAFTEIKAPVDGVVGNRAIQVGDYVQAGQRIAAIVPLSDVYIDANFKETQLARLHPGQPVSVKVDAMPDQAIDGVVASIAPASGAVFSLLPPDNATGNFTKIVQRLSVRVQVPAAVAERGALRPGMSVVASVNTKPGAVAAIAPQMRTAAN